MLSWAGIVLAGLLNGSFAVPLKTTRVWKFNHIWTLHSLLAMGIMPWIVVMAVVPHWSNLLAHVPARGWLILVGWGVPFGIASLLYGIAVDLLGIALGFAIQLGLSIVLGALLPLLWAGAFEFNMEPLSSVNASRPGGSRVFRSKSILLGLYSSLPRPWCRQHT